MKKSRDNFSIRTKEILAKRVNYICSYPGCGQPTVGPSDESQISTSSIGMACHISGASSGSGSRRYNPDLTSEERSHISNGIWMCANHGIKIDRDEERFTAKVLIKFKEVAEEIAKIRSETNCDYKQALIKVDTKEIKEFILDPDIQDISIFESLDQILANPNRHPNHSDLSKGIYYRDISKHNQVNNCLCSKKRALLLGKPGSGKTSLARAIGFELLKEYNVFFFEMHSDIGFFQLLNEIKKHDYSKNIFILDNCHKSIDQVNELVSRFEQIKAAQVLFVSRIFNRSLAGPSESNFVDILENEMIELKVDESVVERIIEVHIRTQEILNTEIGDVSIIFEKTQGDLHLLNFYLLAWQQSKEKFAKISDIKENEVFEAVYRFYLSNQKNTEKMLALSSLSQFEIPVETKWLGSYDTVNMLEKEGWLDTFTTDVSGIRIQLTQFFHSTPSAYILKAANFKGILFNNIDQFTTNNIFDYLSSLPSNFFSIFVYLHRNERDDLQNRLYQKQGFQKIFEEYIKNLGKYDIVYQLVDISKFVRGIWIWENRIEHSNASSILDKVRENISVEEWDKWGETVSLGAFVQTVSNIREINQSFIVQLYSKINYESIGQRSDACGMSTLRKFVEFASVIGVEHNNLRIFFNNFDFSALGRRSRQTGPTTIKNFLELTKTFISKTKINEFCKELNFEALGRKINESGLVVLNRFIQIALSAKVEHKLLKEFCSQIEFDKLPSRFAGNGISPVKNFLRSTLILKIDKSKLRLFTNNLDYTQLALISQEVSLNSINNLLEYNIEVGTNKEKLQLFCQNLRIYPNEQRKEQFKTFESLISEIFS